MPTKKPSTRIAVKTLRRRPTGATRSPAPRDYVDQFVSEWDERRPDLRMSRLSPLMRVLRLSGLMEKDLAEIAKQHAITSAQFQVLAALRRHDPQPLSLSELGRIAILTSGSMTSLVDRLEERALVVRQPHPVDRRGVLLTLTDAGRAVIDAALHNRIERLHRLADTLGEPELDRVSTTLRRLLMAMETAVVDEPGEVAEADGE